MQPSIIMPNIDTVNSVKGTGSVKFINDGRGMVCPINFKLLNLTLFIIVEVIFLNGLPLKSGNSLVIVL